MTRKAVAAPLPAADDAAGRVVLRDGSVATLRPSRREDAAGLKRFFHDLSPESRHRRFFTLAEPDDTLIERLCHSTDPARDLTLLAIRIVNGESRPVAVGSYFGESADSAEVAFAVDDRFHGRGLGTVLLERLAASAIAHGFRRFEATTLAENAAMLEVFRESGFEIRARPQSGTIEVRLSLDPTAEAIASEDRRNAQATVASMRPVLEPRAIAIVGASRDAGSLGRRVFAALRSGGYQGAIYPINPQATEIDGVACYPNVRDAPAGIDLAVVTVPRAAVLDVADDCAAAGVKGLLVITAGFAERGDDDGRALQQQLVEKVRAHGMRMIGPNGMGVMNARDGVRMNASFSPIMPAAGHVALSSQSGTLGVAILELATQRGVGFSTVVSVGNKADVSGNDLLQYWEADEDTAVILLYLESFGNPRRFARLARRIGRKKPIVAIKAGRTAAGSRAASNRTAALAASDAAVDAMFRQSGVIRADTIDEMFDVAACLEAQPLPCGRRVAIVTNAGGPGILAIDACEAAGLTSVRDPVDMGPAAAPDDFQHAVEAALSAPDSDALIIIYMPVDPGGSAATLSAIREGIVAGRRAGAVAKPIVACLMASAGPPLPLVAGAERVPAYSFPENAARALGKAAAYSEWRDKMPGLMWTFDDIHADEARTVCRDALASRGGGWLSGDEVRAVLGAYGLPLAADDMESALVQSMIGDGIETMIGAADDPLFGLVVAFGLAGIHGEVFGDVGFRIGPLTDVDAEELLRDIRGLPLLTGHRGRPAADLDGLRELLLRVSRLAVEISEIGELDLNPVVALPPGQGCRIVDARVRVRRRG